jgi:carbon storage regulator CsrA
MLVLSARPNEKIRFPSFHTTVQVLSIQANQVRLGIDAPEEVRVLRQGIPDRVEEWGPDPSEADEAPTLLRLQQLVDRRLAVTRRGVAEAQARLADGDDDEAEVLLGLIDEDLEMLRRRVRREVEKVRAQTETEEDVLQLV